MVNLKKHNSNNNVDQQLNRLSKISEKMSEYISSGDLQLINHLDKIRKKIILDIEKKKTLITPSSKNNILKLITKNDELIFSLRENKSQQLSETLSKKDCVSAYRKNL